jgi:hypothetical protein
MGGCIDLGIVLTNTTHGARLGELDALSELADAAPCTGAASRSPPKSGPSTATHVKISGVPQPESALPQAYVRLAAFDARRQNTGARCG